ncbi:hypothetical protein K490DRAFT_56034 [Saccharata proteae CBS 121410]|uniref:Uncharacterized protein n=1 Tax=Saccharata proteae CBS 121410 TaxID=1314787 RepID=A0A9P4HZZ6_9PEZI|nr:hypothetical protein K490DRAFT_56034 [Saccharata proteae CBS 121410]
MRPPSARNYARNPYVNKNNLFRIPKDTVGKRRCGRVRMNPVQSMPAPARSGKDDEAPAADPTTLSTLHTRAQYIESKSSGASPAKAKDAMPSAAILTTNGSIGGLGNAFGNSTVSPAERAHGKGTQNKNARNEDAGDEDHHKHDENALTQDNHGKEVHVKVFRNKAVHSEDTHVEDTDYSVKDTHDGVKDARDAQHETHDDPQTSYRTEEVCSLPAEYGFELITKAERSEVHDAENARVEDGACSDDGWELV